jgi:hypothetical protein
MLGLTGLSAIFRNITNVQGLEAAQNLISLDLQDNRITSVNILTNLTRLVVLDLSENRFPQLTVTGTDEPDDASSREWQVDQSQFVRGTDQVDLASRRL